MEIPIENTKYKLKTETKYRIGKTSILFILQCNPSLCSTEKQAQSVTTQPKINLTIY